MAPKSYTARQTAWLVLNACDIRHHDAAERLSGCLPRTDRPAQATDIVYGVLRSRLTLDHVIKHCGALQPERVKPGLWNLLRIGTYELIYAPKTAEYAILNELGDLARRKGSARTVGFINAVLRSVQKQIRSRQIPLAEAAANLLPQDERTGCAFSAAILPEPKKDPVNYFSLAYSLPTWLISRWLQAYGAEQTRCICTASNRNPSLIAQPNTLCTTADKLAERLSQEGIDCETDAEKKMVSIRHTGQITKIQAFLDGLFTIQDPTAAEAMALLEPQPGWTVADLCAAPGGKSIALALLMQDQGTILASDKDPERLKKVRQNVERMRLSCIEIVPPVRIRPRLEKLKRLDAIVLDVPCSNTGVLARRVEARWRLQPKSIPSLLDTQQQLLSEAAGYCLPGMRLVYSTCSIQPEENQQQIHRFLGDHPAFRLIREQVTLPAVGTDSAFDHDGGYTAVLALH